MFPVIREAQPTLLGTSHDKSFVYEVEAEGHMRSRVKAFELAGTILAKFDALKRIGCVVDIHVGLNQHMIVPNGCVYAFDEASHKLAVAVVAEIASSIEQLQLLPLTSIEFYLEMRSHMEEIV